MPRRRVGKIFLILAIFAWSVATDFSQATVIEPMNLERLSRSSGFVLWGKVREIAKNEQGQRLGLVEVFEQIKGQGPKTIKVELLQSVSTDNRLLLRVPMSLELFVDEEVLLFLNKKSHSELYVPVGLQLGKYRIVNDRYQVRRALAWSDAPINKTTVNHLSSSKGAKVSNITGQSKIKKAVSLDSLLNQIRSYR